MTKGKRLFAAVCPTLGHKFAFHAKDENDAGNLIFKWNQHHGFSAGRGSAHTAEEITERQLSGLCIAVHDEYM